MKLTFAFLPDAGSGTSSGRQGMLTELFYGAIRAAIQLGAAAIGWFLLTEFEDIGVVFGSLLVFLTAIGLEAVRAKRFPELYAGGAVLTGVERSRHFYLALVVIGVVIGAVAILPDLFASIDVSRIIFILIVALALWPEIRLAPREYQ
jgi:hypothetical protein